MQIHGKEIKTIIFVIMLLGAHIINNVVNAPKINWYMTLVDNNKRGRFTANKEMFSLISGMAFSYALGAVMDYFEASNNIRTAFILCGIGVFVLMILHSLTLIFFDLIQGKADDFRGKGKCWGLHQEIAEK